MWTLAKTIAVRLNAHANKKVFFMLLRKSCFAFTKIRQKQQTTKAKRRKSSEWRNQATKRRRKDLTDDDFLLNSLLVFNTSEDHQTEKNRRKNRSQFAFSKFFVCNFIHDALWFDASHAAVCVRLHHEVMQDTSWFDANCSVFQRDYSP